MATILIVSRDPRKAASVEADLAAPNHVLLVVASEPEFNKVLTRKPDLAVIDGSSFPPDSAAWEWLSSASADRLIPAIALVPEAALKVWETSGAEDFVVEPYRKSELLFRVRRATRKISQPGEAEVIKHNDLTIDDTSYEVRVGERRVDLTYREYQLLKYLATHPGRVVTRETLLDKVWGFDYYGGDRTVDVHVRRLRSKLEDGEHVFINTVRNVGYRFKG